MAHGLLIDMDGVVYGGDTMIPGADIFVARLLKENIPFIFIQCQIRKDFSSTI